MPRFKMMKKIFLGLVVSTTLVFSSLTLAEENFHGSLEPIPTSVKKAMLNQTWRQECPMPLDKLSYLTVSYWGFDHKTHDGHLIVLNQLAGETLQIFHDLYQMKFPIEKMVLPDVYKSKDDWKSSEDNNTYAFFCRKDEQNPDKFSPHSYGIAIDINPLYNPAAVANDKVQPESGKKYLDRKISHEGMVNEDVVRIFAKHGWKWGGYWSSKDVDYMHFQKDIDEHYTCSSLEFFSKR